MANNDKYSAVWVSHSSMGDFLKCPRAYFLKNVYKDPKTGRKINIVSPALSLGLAVHEVVEGLQNFKAEERFERDLLSDLDASWSKLTGKRGGFKGGEEEAEYKKRAVDMIKRVIEHPGPLKNNTVKIKEGHNGMPPNFFISEDENIILCGKIDWLEYVPEDDSVKILDFKTGKWDEDGESLQLPIYLLLAKTLQKRKISGASYWYLDRDDEPKSVALPEEDSAKARVLEVARKVKEARAKKEFSCPRGEAGCFACQPFEKILRGEAEFVGKGDYQDLYII